MAKNRSVEIEQGNSEIAFKAQGLEFCILRVACLNATGMMDQLRAFDYGFTGGSGDVVFKIFDEVVTVEKGKCAQTTRFLEVLGDPGKVCIKR